MAVGWLHDVVEDADVPLADVAEQFGQEVADAIDAITFRAGESCDDHYRRVVANQTALRVKRAVIAHQFEVIVRARIEPEVRERLAAKYEHAKQVLDALGSGDRGD